MEQVRKRNNKVVPYNPRKIYLCIRKANADCKDARMPRADILAIIKQIETTLGKYKAPSVETIQDEVEKALMRNGWEDTAKAYIIYRNEHAKVRDTHESLMKKMMEITFSEESESDYKRSNANINSNSVMGAMLQYGTTVSNYFNDNYIIPKRFIDAHRNGLIHIHDKDFSELTWNCGTFDTELVIQKSQEIISCNFAYFDNYFNDNLDREWVDVSHEDLKVVSKDGKFTKINKLLRRKHDDIVYDIEFRNGQHLKLTGDHIVEIINNDTPQLKKVSDLVPNDELPITVYPDMVNNNMNELNLLELLQKEESTFIYNSEIVLNHLPNDLREFVISKNKRKKVSSVNECRFTLKEYKLLRKYLIDIDEHELKLSTKGSKNIVPAIIPINKDLGKFIGYVLSEGCVNRKSSVVQFTNQDKTLLSDFDVSVSRLFPEVKFVKRYRVDSSNTVVDGVCSSILCQLFDGIISTKHYSYDIELPQWITYANIGFINGLMSSLIDGDGNTCRQAITYTSVSEKFIKQLARLLIQHNIHVGYQVQKTKGQETRFGDVVSHRNHDTHYLRWYSNTYKDFFDLASDSYKMKKYEWKNGINHPVSGIIKNITKVHYDGYVYDFETENHYFDANGVIVHNCCQIDLQELLHNGFKVGQSTIREPNSIRATAALACIALQSNQNDQFGGQSIQDFDRAMAIGVRKTYKKAFLSAVFDDASYECGNDMAHRIVDYVKTKTLPTYLNDAPIEELVAQCDENIDKDKLRKILTHSYQSACKHTEEETYQAMESLLFNLNTMRSRAGGQMPFSSINFGLDTTAEGRLAMKQFLLVQEKGLGHGETSIFPISIMRLKKGISYNKEDVNYDIFKLAMRVSAKRLFPNFVSVDAPYNAQYYKEDDYRTEIAVMGCRTRVIGNVNGPQISAGRGNFSFTTINLPKIAIESNHDIKAFYKKLDKTMKLCKEQLLWRFNRIGKRHAYNYPFLIGNGVWKGGEKLKLDDTVDIVLKQASLSIGFVGLAECLVSLIGEHHGQSERAQQLGLDIIGKMREMTDKYTSETHLNFSLFASPAESVAGRMLRVTREQYGVIKGVTDHDFFTNSSHVPVYYPITAMDKIRIEAPYHALCNAGCIGYIEMDGDPTKNLEAFERVVRAMHDANMSYFAINHPVDRCPSCGNTTIINGHVCPICGYDEEVHDQKIHMKFDMPMCCN